MTSKHFKNCPECIYGNPCLMVCVNPQCRKPGFVCDNGLKNREECALFHEACEKIPKFLNSPPCRTKCNCSLPISSNKSSKSMSSSRYGPETSATLKK